MKVDGPIQRYTMMLGRVTTYIELKEAFQSDPSTLGNDVTTYIELKVLVPPPLSACTAWSNNIYRIESAKLEVEIRKLKAIKVTTYIELKDYMH